MTLLQSILAFTVAAALLTVTPGLDTALVLRTAIVEGGRRGIYAGLGIVLGCFGWGLMVALGLGLLIASSPAAYTALKWIGAAYLAYLGLHLLRSNRTDLGGNTRVLPDGGGVLTWFHRGFLTNMLNPKVGIFYVSFLPQFIPAGANVPVVTISLTAIHALLGMIWFGVLVLAAGRLSEILQRPRVMRVLDRAMGTIFLIVAARLLLEKGR